MLGLPLGREVEALLTEWDQTLADSKASLQRTTDAEAVGRWSDAEKRDWWSERRDGDAAIQRLLARLEALLGPWKLLFSAPDRHHHSSSREEEDGWQGAGNRW